MVWEANRRDQHSSDCQQHKQGEHGTKTAQAVAGDQPVQIQEEPPLGPRSEPLAVADGDGIRRHPARTANTKAPAAAASARVPAWPPPIDSYGGEPTPALPSSPPGLPRFARRAAVIRNRGEHDLEGRAILRSLTEVALLR